MRNQEALIIKIKTILAEHIKDQQLLEKIAKEIADRFSKTGRSGGSRRKKGEKKKEKFISFSDMVI